MWICTNCGKTNADDTNNFCGQCGQARGEIGPPSYDLYLTGFDADRKISVITHVREVTNYGLKEAKDLVEQAPQLLSANLAHADAERIKVKMQAAGAQIEICAHGAPPSHPVTPRPQQIPFRTGCTGLLLALAGIAVSIAILWCSR